MRQAQNTASLALQLKWMSQQLARDLPTLDAAQRRERSAELQAVEEALRRAQAVAGEAPPAAV